MDLVKRADEVLEELDFRKKDLERVIQQYQREIDVLSETGTRIRQQLASYKAASDMGKATKVVVEKATDVLVQLEEAVLSGGEAQPSSGLVETAKRVLAINKAKTPRVKARPKKGEHVLPEEAKPAKAEKPRKQTSASPRGGRVLRSSFVETGSPPKTLKEALVRTYGYEKWRTEKVQIMGQGQVRSITMSADPEAEDSEVNPRAVPVLATHIKQAVGVLEKVRHGAVKKEDLSPGTRALYDLIHYGEAHLTIQSTLRSWGITS